MPYKDPVKRKSAALGYSRKYQRSLTPEQIARDREQQRTRRKSRSKEQRRNEHLRKYDLTSEEWDIKFEAQDKCCEICKSPEPFGRWCTDHDHVSGKVRGILCNKCNVMVGQSADRHAVLIAAAFYLLRYREAR